MNARLITRCAGLAFVSALAVGAAFAGGPRVGVSINFHVPARIHAHHVHDYRSYSVGHVYFAPHRHAHVVYAFPVRGRYVPHVYCGGELVRTGYVPTYDPRYDDYRAGYADVVWDCALAPSYLGITVHARPRWADRRYRYDGDRYYARPGRYDRYDRPRYHHYHDGCDDDDDDDRGRKYRRHERRGHDRDDD